MRFAPAPRPKEYEATARKRSAVLIRQRKDREKLPLFGELIRETQADPDEVLRDRADSILRNQIDKRQRAAADWVRGRAAMRALPEPERGAFLRYWNRLKSPANGSYLLTYLNMLATGRLIMDAGEMDSRAEVEWRRGTLAKIAAMSDAELDGMIQTHFSPLFVEWGRAERRRRAEAAAAEAPAPRPRRAAGARR